MLEECQFVTISQKHLLFPNSPFQLHPDNEYEFPFDPQPLPLMFDSEKPQKSSNPQTPQKSYPQRRYQSERVERKTYNFESSVQPMRSQKGLRHLSIKVKEIVFELRSTSYKDVAERLIQELSKEEGRFFDCDNSKDEQNIKRRVYDALNVMIASKVLRKDGKRVKSDINNDSLAKHKLFDRDSLKDKLIRKQNLLQGKKRHLVELMKKWKAANQMIDRNKNLNQMQHFNFPILVFFSDSQNVKFIKEYGGLKIRTKKQLDILSDLDITKQLFQYSQLLNSEPVDLLNLYQECENLQ